MLKIKEYGNYPYDYLIVDEFLPEDLALSLAESIPEYGSQFWNCFYNNPLEKKKACNDWNRFTPLLYTTFDGFLKPSFVKSIEDRFGESGLIPDYGLHGGGVHISKSGDKLNLHLDYSTHPKLGYKRKLNLIYYLTPNWDPAWGGGLQLWSHDVDTNKPKELVNTIENKFNRLVIFDVSDNAWHGFPEPLTCPENIERKSLATYYLKDESDIYGRNRARYAPMPEQETDPIILELIEQRSK